MKRYSSEEDSPQKKLPVGAESALVTWRTYLRLTALFPKRVMEETRTLLKQAGIEVMARQFVAFSFMLSVLVALNAFFISSLFLEVGFEILAIISLVAFVATEALLYGWLLMAADARAKRVEALLPSLLQIISANIRAGMILEHAIWSSARPELGPLKDEIKKVGADVFGGKPLRESFVEMTRRVKSLVLERCVRLINEGLRLGGEMASLLDEVANEIRSTQLLQKEIATTTATYALFVVFASVVAAPLLFSVSVTYAEMNERIMAKKATPELTPAVAGAGPMAGIAVKLAAKKEPAIEAGEVRLFAIGAIALTTFFAALILGLIRTGSALLGIKYAPAFVVAALAIFFAAHAMVSMLLGGVAP